MTYNDNRRRKSDAEARTERFTWFFLVLIFAIVYLLPESVELPNSIIPFAGAAVLLLSGIYQYMRRWRVSPITWIVGTILLVFGVYSLQINPRFDFYGISLLAFALVILAGLMTGET